MKPLNVPVLLLILVVGAGFGAQMLETLSARGHSLPIAGWLTTVVLLVLAAVLLVHGLPLRRYMLESAERKEHPSFAPRRHQIDLPTAYRTVLLARACAYTGAVVGGIFTGQALFLLITGIGDPLLGILPTAVAAVAGIVLGALGVIVERWGQLPPEDGEGSAEGAGAGS
ncbi:MAG: DUF3180 domain-containing protein [Brachybacterium sp.]|uniref:DUF3180 domain-containing protein n=1 Tax=unclassified Brachybacterium TaxID=2623841 RepID=UPI001861AA4C|nr:DUF3180 domain-containing protein [Brachybacterium sp. Z12]QNN83291.1 DUF3180 domain-containing protein [Brachybacterium sp. Z12]